MDSKIIQIIPAPANLKALYREGGVEITSLLLCIALKDDGDIVLIDIDNDGWIDEAESMANYAGVKWGE